MQYHTREETTDGQLQQSSIHNTQNVIFNAPARTIPEQPAQRRATLAIFMRNIGFNYLKASGNLIQFP